MANQRSEILDDLKRVGELVQGQLNAFDYDVHGNFSVEEISSTFGSWQDALKEAGLSRNRSHQSVDGRRVPSRHLKQDIRLVASQIDPPYTKKKYEEKGNYSINTINRRFDSWKRAKKMAGVERTVFGKLEEELENILEGCGIQEEEIFDESKRIIEECSEERYIEPSSAIYAALRIHKMPYTRKDILANSEVSKDRFKQSYTDIKNCISSIPPPPSPQKFVSRYAKELDLPDAVTDGAKSLLDEFYASSPDSLAAAAVYISAKEAEESITQQEVSTISHVSEVTLRSNIKKLE